MKRWGLLLALLLSLGMNAGILLTLAVDGDEDGEEARVSRPWRESQPEERRDRPGGRYGRDRMIERLADGLELEGEVRERFLEVQRRFREDLVVLGRRRHRIQQELRLELTAPEPDGDRVEQLTEALGEATGEMERALARGVLETRQLLDGERERRYLAFIERLRDRGGRQRPVPRRP